MIPLLNNRYVTINTKKSAVQHNLTPNCAIGVKMQTFKNKKKIITTRMRCLRILNVIKKRQNQKLHNQEKSWGNTSIKYIQKQKVIFLPHYTTDTENMIGNREMWIEEITETLYIPLYKAKH